MQRIITLIGLFSLVSVVALAGTGPTKKGKKKGAKVAIEYTATGDSLHIHTNGLHVKRMQVVGVAGSVMHSYTPESDCSYLPLNGATKGLYRLHIKYKGGEQTETFVVE